MSNAAFWQLIFDYHAASPAERRGTSVKASTFKNRLHRDFHRDFHRDLRWRLLARLSQKVSSELSDSDGATPPQLRGTLTLTLTLQPHRRILYIVQNWVHRWTCR